MPFPIPEDLPDPGIKPESLAFPALAGRFFTTGKSKKQNLYKTTIINKLDLKTMRGLNIL